MASNQRLEYYLALKDGFTKKMKEAEDRTKGLDSAMSGLGGKIAAITGGIGIVALGKEMVQTGAKFDAYKLQLETLLGTQAEASLAFNKIKEDAAKTPFDVASLTQANTMLISAGTSANEARAMVMNLGNAIAATGGGSDELSRMAVNLQQIKTLGKASAMDVKQFAFAGIPIYQMLAKTTGKTVEKLRGMDITYEQLSASFEKAAQKGGMFYGGLEKQSQAIGGQLSNLGDQFTNTLVGFYDRLKPTIAGVIGMLSKMLAWANRNQETLIFLGKMTGLILGIVAAVKTWTAVTTGLKAAQLALNIAMAANPVGAIIVAVSALIGTLAILISQYKTIEDLHSESVKNRMTSAMQEETKQVEFLTAKYEKLGRSKSEAMSLAIAASKRNLAGEYSEAKTQLARASTEEEKRIAQLRIASLGGRNQALDIMAKGRSGGNASSKGTAKGGSLGSSTEISGAKPQSIIINITKLVEELSIQTTNLSDSASKIREEVAKALLEAVNDVNILARAT
jgi:tape measure domain-containing protein